MFTEDLFLNLNSLLLSYPKEQVFVLTDENVAHHCLPHFKEQINDFPHTFLKQLDSNTLVIPAGERHKTIAEVERIWDFLIDKHATRKAIMILLGGGVITDMGGFAASCYMRGIDFVNIPTTLLAVIDASEGGKTGIDYRNLKNSIGVFRQAKANLIYLPFLKTLPLEQFLSGYAEMIKHALIADRNELNRLLAFDIEALLRPQSTEQQVALMTDFQELIARSMEIKQYIVEQDCKEQNIRRYLNFGHTIGHALEELQLKNEPAKPVYHGYAVFWGMIAELYISHIRLGLPTDVITRLTQFMLAYYGRPDGCCKDYDLLIDLMHHDKKNDTEGINFTFLKQVGNPQINQTATEAEIREALDYLFTI